MNALHSLARDAIEVQSACNLTAVAHGFSEAIVDLREIMPTLSTMDIRRHPIAVMWAYKIADMVSLQMDLECQVCHDAYQWCKENASDGTESNE